MFSQTMRTAVLQATALFTISTLLSHHMSESAFSQIAENEGWINMTTALNKSSPHNIPYGRGLLTLDAGAEAIMIRNNATTKNGTFDADKAHSESYHLQVLPRQVVTFLIMSVLQYWWYIALEKMLPARPSRYTSTEKPQLQEKLSEDSEDREEEVVKRWIAQGRVRRASLNWCNTFLKWILDMTVGRLCYYAVEISIAMLISKLQSAPDGALRGPKNVRCPCPLYPLLRVVLTTKLVHHFRHG
jgi:hypothetical protein